MTNRLTGPVFRAFEERHSPSFNSGSRPPYRQTFYARALPSQQRERAADYCLTEHITEPEPSDAVQLVLNMDLALHLIRCRTPSYRVRRDVARSAKARDSNYVPLIDYELHFSALSLWLKRYPELPAIFRQGHALHPALLALIEIATAVAKLQGKPLANSREEYEYLSDDQLLYNLIGERMRSWAANPANATRIKVWEKRLDKDKQDFLERWTPADGSLPHQLLRFDLSYDGQTGSHQGFGGVPADVVKKHVTSLRETLASSPNFSGLLVEFFPYADLTVMWMIPGLILVPASGVSALTLLTEIKSLWQKITGLGNGGLQDNYTTMHGAYRYVSDEQRMLDPLWLQLSRAVTYLFDTRLIFDSSLSYFGSEDSKRNNPSEQIIYFEE